MKLIVLTFLTVLYAITTEAQNVAINNNGANADASAMLDISSTNKGMLVPRMGTVQRTMIVNPANGLLVFDTNTGSFWYYSATSSSWQEIAGGGAMSGPAGGDLSGNYPAPSVVKIQNLDVAFGVPFNKQVLKWDMLNNRWQGENDSLFLPYNATFGSATKLFGITNTNSTNGATAVYGKSGSGAGITPGTTIGVWGDNTNGIGVIGTSTNGVGTYGFSFQNHGVYGYTTNNDFAGVYGSHANAGAGILGEVSNGGKAVHGRSAGTTGKAGYFESINTAFSDTTLVVKNAGFGTNTVFQNTNSGNGNAVVVASNNATGDGFYSELTNTGNAANASFRGINNSPGGYGVYAESTTGRAGYFFNSDASNNNPALDVKTNGTGVAGNFAINYASSSNYAIQGTTSGTGGGLKITIPGATSNATGINVTHSGTGIGIVSNAAKGKAAVFSNTDPTNNQNILEATTTGTGSSAFFYNNNTANASNTVTVYHSGTGRGVAVNLTNASSQNAAFDAYSAGKYGVYVSTNGTSPVGITSVTGASSNNAVAIKGQTASTASGGIGVLGQAGANDPTGIGVKGIAGGAISGGIGVLGEAGSGNPQAVGVKGTSYNGNETVGAVTGINFADGVGVYGESQGLDGIGVVGVVGNTNQHNVAAMFRNNYSSNNRAVIEIFSNGMNNAIFSENTNLSNTSDILHFRNAGTGNFLKFETNLGDVVTTIAKNGNITTDGNITVKTNKGIVRNSTATQLRTELLSVNVPAGSVAHHNEFNGAIVVNVTFTTPFSAAPVVTLGNFVSGDFAGLTTEISGVTTTGFTLYLWNWTPYDITIPSTTVKFLVVGAD